jgi:hypothetical protein
MCSNPPKVRCGSWPFSNSGRGVKLSMSILAGFRVLSAVGVYPPHVAWRHPSSLSSHRLIRTGPSAPFDEVESDKCPSRALAVRCTAIDIIGVLAQKRSKRWSRSCVSYLGLSSLKAC